MDCELDPAGHPRIFRTLYKRFQRCLPLGGVLTALGMHRADSAVQLAGCQALTSLTRGHAANRKLLAANGGQSSLQQVAEAPEAGRGVQGTSPS